VKQELSVYALRALPVRDHVSDAIELGFERADHIVDAVNQTPDNVFTCGDEEVFQITHCGLDLTGQPAHACDQLLNLVGRGGHHVAEERSDATWDGFEVVDEAQDLDRKSTRLNSSHVKISYAV